MHWPDADRWTRGFALKDLRFPKEAMSWSGRPGATDGDEHLLAVLLTLKLCQRMGYFPDAGGRAEAGGGQAAWIRREAHRRGLN